MDILESLNIYETNKHELCYLSDFSLNKLY